MYYLGISLGIYLILGLLTAIRVTCFDGGRFKNNTEILIKIYEDKGDFNTANMLRNKKVVFSLIVLLGVFAFIADFKATFKKRK